MHPASVCFHLHFLTQDISPNLKLTGARLVAWSSEDPPVPALLEFWVSIVLSCFIRVLETQTQLLSLCGNPFVGDAISQTVGFSLFVLSPQYFRPSPWFHLFWFSKSSKICETICTLVHKRCHDGSIAE